MRLIHTSTLEFRDFHVDVCPGYGILSHRWGADEDEPTFQDYRKGRKRETTGYAKICAFCSKLADLGVEWGWVDTVCIDKKSSAELSEAINSMFEWYRRSLCCLVHLADAEAEAVALALRYREPLRSTWFTRGWTLQELLAPHILLFYDQDWRAVGKVVDIATRVISAPIHAALEEQPSLTDIISIATGIPKSHLSNARVAKEASIAQRMCWASRRQTTRGEDEAYCLLGLMGVNLSLLYGEGRTRAFERLQKAILEVSNDETIFAFSNMLGDQTPLSRDLNFVGPLARSARAFGHSGSIITSHVVNSLTLPPFKMTNRGLKLIRPSWTLASEDTSALDGFPFLNKKIVAGRNVRLLRLACAEFPDFGMKNMLCYIMLVQDRTISGTNQWFRVLPMRDFQRRLDWATLQHRPVKPLELFYIGSFQEFDSSGPSIDWSIRSIAPNSNRGSYTPSFRPMTTGCKPQHHHQ
jgi:hypothetical protein